ncbi:MAG: hypothetical protein AAF696_24260 [Bacteroidota bacterium]
MRFRRKVNGKSAGKEGHSSKKEHIQGKTSGFREIVSSQKQEKVFREFNSPMHAKSLSKAIKSENLGISREGELYLQIMRLEGAALFLPNTFEDREAQLKLEAPKMTAAYSPYLLGRAYGGRLEGIAVQAYLSQVSLGKEEDFLIICVLDARKKEGAAKSYAMLIAKALEDSVHGRKV